MPGPGVAPAGVGELPSGAGTGPSGQGSEPARPGSEPALRSSALVRRPAGPATSLALPALHPALPDGEPVFVLCTGRSGSTLLRFLLDAHPQLACPPETRLASMCAQIAGVWSQLEGSPLPTERVSGPPAIPDAALAGIRHTMDQMITPYLQRRGKRRYCDKSLGAAEHADVLRAVFPGAKFLCLYRHPMDVIASGIEACPWGLNGFGFDAYADRSPRNTVLALAQFWAANVTLILGVEERFRECSFRVRYEDLVADPEKVSEAIFRFLGVPPVPGLPEACFTAERERAGPADYKIWHTSRIESGSVGRGWSIPAALIGSPLTATINDLADKLGYARIDDRWGISPLAPDPRLPGSGRAESGRAQSGQAQSGRVQPGQVQSGQALPGQARSGPVQPGQAQAQSGRAQSGLRMVVAHLLSGLAGLDDRFNQRWGQCSRETFLLTVTVSGGSSVAARWRVDLGTRTVTSAEGLPAGETGGARWEIIGPVDLWTQVVEGQTNLSVALRHRLLRYCDTGEPVSTMLNRVAMLADLLGITIWQQAQPPGYRRERPAGDGPPRLAPDRAAPAPNGPRPVYANGPVRAGGPGYATGPVYASGPVYFSGPMPVDGPVYSSGPVYSTGPMPAVGPVHTNGPVPANSPPYTGSPVPANGPVSATGPLRASGPMSRGGPMSPDGPMSPGGPIPPNGPGSTDGPARFARPAREPGVPAPPPVPAPRAARAPRADPAPGPAPVRRPGPAPRAAPAPGVAPAPWSAPAPRAAPAPGVAPAPWSAPAPRAAPAPGPSPSPAPRAAPPLHPLPGQAGPPGRHAAAGPPDMIFPSTPPVAMSPAALPAGWGMNPRASVTITVVRPRRAPRAPRRRPEPSGYAADPGYQGRSELEPGVAQFFEPREGDPRAAWLAQRERDAARARRRW